MCLGQDQPKLVIDSVVISESPYVQTGYRDIPVSNGHFASVAESVNTYTSAYVKSYGLGSIATLSVRGSNSNQNLVLWENVPVDNPMLGLSDLSLLQGFENVSLRSSNRKPELFTSVIGGVINVSDQHTTKHGWGAEIEGKYGSFDYINSQIKGYYTGSRLTLDLQYFKSTSDNDFAYNIPGIPETKKMPHNKYALEGIRGNVRYTLHNNHAIGYHVWLQSAFRQIPPTVLQNFSNGEQEDIFNRHQLSYNYDKGPLRVRTTLAYLDDQNNYQDSTFAIDNHNTYKQYFVNSALDYTGNQYKYGVDLAWTSSGGQSESYNGVRQIDRLLSRVHYSLHFQKNTLGLSASKEITTLQNSPLVPAVIFKQRFSNIDWYISILRKYRLPTLNELFWIPGGNQDLSPENGWAQEAGSSYKKGSLEIHVDLYHRMISDWILWTPVNGSFIWSPKNIERVRSYGMEIRLLKSSSAASCIHRTNLTFAYTRSVLLESLDLPMIASGDQLFYTPEIKLQGDYQFKTAHWSLGVFGIYSGPVKGTQEERIAGYFLLNTSVRYTLPLDHVTIDLFGELKNITNSNYQIIEYRPLPGTHFLIGAKIKFNN